MYHEAPPPHFSKCSAASEEAPSLKAKILEALVVYKNYVAKLEFLGRRGGGDAKQKTFCGGSMDISGSKHSDLKALKLLFFFCQFQDSTS